ncbi:MAG: prolipoprotein diacylglyceryl transferase [Saprospiraceae bacterium]
MYPDLSYLLHDLLPSVFERDGAFSVVKMFGLLLALAFVASAYTCGSEMIRKEQQGLLHPKTMKIIVGKPLTMADLAMNALIGFLVGFKFIFVFQNFSAFKADAAGIIFSSKGNLFGGIIGGILFVAYNWWESRKNEKLEPEEKLVKVYPHERIGDITIVSAISGIAGAKLFSILENFEDFLLDPAGQLFSGSGLTMYGGLILAFIVVYIYIKRLGIAPLHMMDCAAPAITVGYGVGRLGCHFSGDGDWGIVNDKMKPFSFLPDWLWSYTYPHNVLNEGVALENCIGQYCSQLSAGVFPTPLYETLLCALMLMILWSLRTRIKIPGLLFFVYLVLNGLERFSIESIRVNPRYEYFGMYLSQAQYIAIMLMLLGVAGMALMYVLDKKTKLVD